MVLVFDCFHFLCFRTMQTVVHIQDTVCVDNVVHNNMPAKNVQQTETVTAIGVNVRHCSSVAQERKKHIMTFRVPFLLSSSSTYWSSLVKSAARAGLCALGKNLTQKSISPLFKVKIVFANLFLKSKKVLAPRLYIEIKRKYTNRSCSARFALPPWLGLLYISNVRQSLTGRSLN